MVGSVRGWVCSVILLRILKVACVLLGRLVYPRKTMLNLTKLLHYARTARHQAGKSYLSQFTEIASLAAGRGRLGASEYYEFGVFDDAAFPPGQKQQCVGWRSSDRIDQSLNQNAWRATANDKLLNYALLQHYGLAIPETLASYCPRGSRIGQETAIGSVEALTQYLRHGLVFPVFIKPIHGSYGRGTYRLDSYEAGTECFLDAHAKRVHFDEVLGACLMPQYKGMLFQKCLQPHAQVLQLVGSTTSCVRVIVAMTGAGPQVHMAFWKIARTHNITDNFCMGETGNLLAWVNKDSGIIERVVTGLWPDGQEVSAHPDTGQTLLGAQLPQWEQAMSLCFTAATHFMGLKLQHWDVAFCMQGPVLMELNTEADLGVPQYLGRTPFVNPTINAMLASPA